jgi:hypothetical protein
MTSGSDEGWGHLKLAPAEGPGRSSWRPGNGSGHLKPAPASGPGRPKLTPATSAAVSVTTLAGRGRARDGRE